MAWFFLMGFLIWCVSCASPPSIIAPELRATVDASASFPLVIEDPQRFLGKIVMWGGTILNTTVREDGSLLEILQRPLDNYDHPGLTAPSEGRFLVERRGQFLDPAVFAEGEAVTVIGTIAEERIQPIGELNYRYPVVVASQVYLWPERPLPYGLPYWYWGYPYGYWYGSPYGFWPPYGFSPYGRFPLWY